jgi:hypothetical protein
MNLWPIVSGRSHSARQRLHELINGRPNLPLVGQKDERIGTQEFDDADARANRPHGAYTVTQVLQCPNLEFTTCVKPSERSEQTMERLSAAGNVRRLHNTNINPICWLTASRRIGVTCRPPSASV